MVWGARGPGAAGPAGGAGGGGAAPRMRANSEVKSMRELALPLIWR